MMVTPLFSFVKYPPSPADKLQFYIGTQLSLHEWSGVNEGWRRKPIMSHRDTKPLNGFMPKNGSTNGGSDRGWLDNIVLPPAVCLTLWAGSGYDICPGEEPRIQESYGTGYNTVEWTSSGTGTFDDNTQIQPVYFPSDEDIANQSVNLTMTLTDGTGNIVSDDMVLTIKIGPGSAANAEGPDYVDLFLTTSSVYSDHRLPRHQRIQLVPGTGGIRYYSRHWINLDRQLES